MSMTFRTLAAMAAVIALVACGGGGGGKTANNGGPTGPGGGNPPPPAPAINTVAMGSPLVVALGRLYRGSASCRGTACTVTALGQSVPLDFSDYIDPSATPVPITGQHTRNGVRVGRVAVSDSGLRFDTYGLWGVYNAATPVTGSGSIQGVSLEFTFPVSMGSGSGSNPVSGSATWAGVMAGVKVGRSSLGAEVTGDAELTADLSASTLGLAFTNIADRSGARSGDIRWQDVPMRNGAFTGTGGLKGRFYGPHHEEAGGVFERDGIAGAFSLGRQ